ncbi:MAG: bifunctional diaminohydroxyphosphoribosylaminopyrimidine deaminase/5-amino-6-(5-phosphoribosylamino)uracil reductase RibD [Salibacteraceae bacterium]|nr:bifunctional diaminohydroxyphosphoribosylaminopyrimidine deaminase/5-amino-6-(5-phosphoribosylamino)uracil reductase RibD [Salibacteraceae bacterium]MDP4933511.1 bifunctional diaminohydroxyphosphoribosylaminopyrimidine deaminase/5-amino-6-(5-phosphoribosylamino)uracil reductase RibD [Salibacteraceae bacterium]
MNQHEIYMQRCLELAALGLGNTAPNPLVGSIIVHQNQIIGEGYHQQYGEAHAEVNAINSVENKALLAESTLYVNLEPCAHHGKTPPCADLIIAHNIPQVVICNRDPFHAVDGKGIERLQAAGIEVITGVLEDEGREVNKRFFTFHEQKRPYIILKWAETADGYLDYIRIADDNEKPLKISNEQSSTLVHKWRTEEAAILVGRRTAELDNPSLTARLWPGKNPLRLVIDPQLEVPEDSAMYNDGQPTWVFNALREYCEREVCFVKINDPATFELEIMQYLHQQNIQSVIIEGGANTLHRFIQAGIWDEARIITGNLRIGDGLAAPRFTGKLNDTIFIDKDKLELYTRL